VAQLAGYVSENAAYHHGEVSLTAAIVNMAQNFVGSNNVNLLVPNGQFGTRLLGGDDAASPRYIFTCLEPIGASILSKADDPGLSWLEDDGQTVEPEYYLPVLPMLLVNGSVGIGTGYSTEILPYNPKDLVSCLKRRLMGTLEDMSDIRLTPWWDGFKGPVTMDGKQVMTKGIYQFLDNEANQVRITELPVGTWTKTYKAFLDELLSGVRESESASAGKYLKSFQEAYNDVDVEFVLTLDAEYYSEARAFPAEFEKKFKLSSSYKLSNMVAFHDGRIRRFDGPGEVLETFYVRRLAGYVARKASELARLDAEIVEVDARARFIKAVVDGTLVVSNADDTELLAGLMALELPRLSKSGDGQKPSLADFEYVLKLRIDRLKAKAVLDLQMELESLKMVRETLAAKSPETLWLTDLNMFSVAYDKFHAAREATRVSEVKAKKVVKKKT
jgi:DNA topoisomerase-2